MERKDITVYKKNLPARKALYAGFPEELHGDIKDCLEGNGIKALYSHQA